MSLMCNLIICNHENNVLSEGYLFTKSLSAGIENLTKLTEALLQQCPFLVRLQALIMQLYESRFRIWFLF